MRKSVKREKELDRSYDYADSVGFKRAAKNVGFVKCRANRRLRHDTKRIVRKEKEAKHNDL